MTYGNKLLCFFTILSLLFIVGCEKNIKDFHFDLYDGYTIKNIDNKIKLYKDNNVVEINNLDYKIKEYKYNSDVVCLKLDNNEYYMIYYYNSSVFGPYTKETLKNTIDNDSTMSFDSDFKNILKADVIYDE